MSFIKSKHSGWTWDLKRTPFGGGKGGNGGGTSAPSATSSTVNQSNIPEYARPYVETMLGVAQQQIFNYDDSGNVISMKPYTPYSQNATDYIAGFSPLQQQAQSNVANMQTPGGYATGTNYAQTAGLGALSTANPAAQYGGMGANAGLAGMQQGMSYGQNATDPNAVAAYMNPYLQATLNPAMQLQNQQFGQINAQNQGQATQQGAFGGGRQAVMQGLNQQNQMLAQNQLVGNAYNQAYNTANQNMQNAASLGMQGTAQAMQGAGIGLQGVGAQQAAYGQLGAQGTNLANIAGAQNQTELNINAAQQASGAAQQAQQQNIINQQIQNYATEQQYPMMQLGNMSNLLRGLPMQSTTAQTYQAAPSAVSTLGGLGATALGAYGAAGGFKSAKEGGLMKSYAAGGAVAFDVGGAVIADLENMTVEQLVQQAKTSSSATVRQEAIRLIAEKQNEAAVAKGIGTAPATNEMFTAAAGGIVAFAEGDLVEEPSYFQKMKERLGKATEETTAIPSSLSSPFGIPLFGAADKEKLTKPVAETPAKTELKPDSKGRYVANAEPEAPVAPAAKTGLGATTPVQARAPAIPTKDTDIGGPISSLYKQLQETSGTAEDRKLMSEEFKKSREAAKADREQNMWLALMKGGAKAMANKSPFGNVGLGEGAEAAAEGAIYANKAYNQAIKDVQSGELDLAKLNSAERTNLLHYAVTGAVSDSNTRIKMQELKEIAATRAAGAGQQNLARQDAAITARAKLLLGNNPMPTEQDVENAIATATRQVMGKEVAGGIPKGVTVKKVG